jgi:hypothetical protein
MTYCWPDHLDIQTYDFFAMQMNSQIESRISWQIWALFLSLDHNHSPSNTTQLVWLSMMLELAVDRIFLTSLSAD